MKKVLSIFLFCVVCFEADSQVVITEKTRILMATEKFVMLLPLKGSSENPGIGSVTIGFDNLIFR